MKNTFGIRIIPENDPQRLEVLYRYQLLGTAPEKAFDNLAHIIAQVFGTPIALISLVDRDEVFFKANVGLPGVTHTPRGVSLCSLGILTGHPVVFENTLHEPCLLANPLVTGEFGLRFYAAAPLVSPDGHNIGTVCIVDKSPRSFSDENRLLLQRFAATVMHEIELRLAARVQSSELERKVQERAAELTASNLALTRLNRELEQLLHVASHDLLEPLRKIVLFSGLTETILGASLHGDAKEHWQRVRQNARRMQQVMHDLLALLRIGRAEEAHTPVDLNQVMDDVRHDLEARITETSAVIEVPELPVVKAARAQMHRLLRNLLDNALKFSVPGIPPRITLNAGPLPAAEQARHGLPAHRDYTRIVVSDNGIGMETEYLEQIFSIFQRLHGRSEYTGTGIGLAMCRRIAENHGGIVFAGSTPGQGAEFTVLLPLAAQQAPHADTAVQAEAHR